MQFQSFSVVRYWRGYLSAARCKLFAYGPTDATLSSPASLKLRMVYLSIAGLPGCSSSVGLVRSFFHQKCTAHKSLENFLITSYLFCHLTSKINKLRWQHTQLQAKKFYNKLMFKLFLTERVKGWWNLNNSERMKFASYFTELYQKNNINWVWNHHE